MKFWVTEEEKRLIDEKMKLLPTQRYGAYLRKMAIDGYIIYTDMSNLKEMNKTLFSIGRNINQLAKKLKRPRVSGRYGRDTGKAGSDMAVTKTHPIKSTLKAAIDYISNPDKTDGKLLVFAYGCAAETADIEFAWTSRHAIDKGTNLGRHLIQAFEPSEVSPEEGHEIGMQLAKEILDGKYEFVLTTHIDKDHVHNTSFLTPSALRIISTTIPTKEAITKYAASLTDCARNTVCPWSFPDRTRARAILNIRQRETAPATRQS